VCQTFHTITFLCIVAAYLLAILGGKENPDKKAVTDILTSVGVKADDDKLDLFFKEIEGKNVDTLINEGKAKLAKFGGGGGGGGGAAAVAAPSAAAPAAKKEEPKKSSSSSSVGGGGMNLFGDD